MEQLEQHLINLQKCIDLEEDEQRKRYQLDAQHSLKALKHEGLAIHPIRVNRKSYGFADYPEISFRIPFPSETNGFRDGCAIECFCVGEETIKGILLFTDGKQGEFRLFTSDFPDWIEDEGVGIKLAVDTKTTEQMKKALEAIPQNKDLLYLFKQIHDKNHPIKFPADTGSHTELSFLNSKLNDSQRTAIKAIINNDDLLVVHGPPGTGKTTTLIEAIVQLVKSGRKILVSAPSNSAVDHLAGGLIGKNINFLRIGNNTKVKESIFPFTPEGKLKDSKEFKEIKKLKIRAEELRKMSHQYKRNFGKEEREQRNLLIKEVKNIRKQILDIQKFSENALYDKAQVILGTPIALVDSQIKDQLFDTLFIDEAGQCLEPLAWCIFPFAKNIVLAGDHLQLPPTVLSSKAIELGFNKSILEVCFTHCKSVYLLDTQYRMRESIARFSNDYFYEGKLKTTDTLMDTGVHFTFYDTAGSGFEEENGKDGHSLMNSGEINVINQLLSLEKLDLSSTAVISPYAGQVSLAKESLPNELRISTIDSFQGQEEECVLISLVRSNDRNEVGFLKDHRRMNVAMTRAKEKLFIIGDSSTLAHDPYFSKLIEYAEMTGAYKSIWEIMY